MDTGIAVNGHLVLYSYKCVSMFFFIFITMFQCFFYLLAGEIINGSFFIPPKYAERVYSFHPFPLSVHLFDRPSICPDVIPSVNPFCNQVLLRSFLITYNSAATDQKLFIFGMGVPGRVLFHSTSMNPWVMPQGRARGQNLGHPNKVVYCSFFIQTTSHINFSYLIRSRSL